MTTTPTNTTKSSRISVNRQAYLEMKAEYEHLMQLADERWNEIVALKARGEALRIKYNELLVSYNELVAKNV